MRGKSVGKEAKSAETPPSGREKPKTNWQNGLQICGEGSISRKRPTRVVGKNSNGKSQVMKVFPIVPTGEE